MQSGRFLPIKLGEGGSYFRKDDLLFFYVTAFPNGLLLGTSSYSVGNGVIDFWKNIFL